MSNDERAERRPTLFGLSCGTGLCGVALARGGHDVVFSDLEVNVATVRYNIRLRLAAAAAASWCTIVQESVKRVIGCDIK